MIIGIDLGTTNSLAACFRNGKVELIPNRLNQKLTPSVVAVDDQGQILIGETAREYGYLHPQAMARLFKRTMGTDRVYHLNDTTLTSEELSALILRSLKEDAEAYLGESVEEAVISVPAYFNDHQRKATKQAGEMAGLKVNRIINEPTASALAYGIGETDDSECCMVLDLGGGTFDVTILEYYNNIMEVYAVAGDNQLGGEDFTMTLMEMFLQRNGLDESDLTLRELSDLYKAAEQCKCSFSSGNNSYISAMIQGRPVSEEFTLDEFAENCLTLMDRLRKPIEKSLRDAKITLLDLSRIIMVGGATRLPTIRSYVQEMTGIYPDYYVDPDTSVAQGAAIAAAMKERNQDIEEIILTDVCPFTLGTEVISDNGRFDEELRYLPIIERNTVIPVSRTERVYTAHDNQKEVTVRILQGESRLPRSNLLIGWLNLEVPVGPKGQEAIDITYTYDVNSLLEVRAKVVSTGLEKSVVIQNNENKLSDEEVRKRLEKLSYLRQNPREEEANMYAIFRADRLYESSEGSNRQRIEKEMAEFERILDQGTRLQIEKQRQQLLQVLDEVEGQGKVLLS